MAKAAGGAGGAKATGAPKAGARGAGAAKGAGGAKAAGVGSGRMIRRKVVWYGVFGFIGVCAAATLRFFFPRVLFEPKTRFRIGFPSDYGIGVNTRYRATQRIWVVRDAGALFVVFAKCTHLGCTPDWKESEGKFKCPCHGSGFDTEGMNFEGPAPRPLDRVHIELDAEGYVVVDKARLYGPDDWKKPGAFLEA